VVRGQTGSQQTFRCPKRSPTYGGRPDRRGRRADHDTERPGLRGDYRLSAAEAGEFLVDLGEQLQESDEVTVAGEEWELPFSFGEPVTVELDFEGVDDQELEVEVELPGRPDETAPDVR
jgi:amphi-Trp domain-containing protein